MRKKSKEITVIIPTKDRVPVLKESLQAINNGSMIPDEVIVIDDGSQRPIAEALDTIKYAYPLKVIRQEFSKGAAAARNRGAKEAKGKILVFIDDDILPDYNMIYFHRKLHHEHPEKEFGVQGRIYFDPNMPRTPLLHYLEEEGVFVGATKYEDKKRIHYGLISANFSIKKALIRNQQCVFDESFPFNRNEDTEFGLRMIEEQDFQLYFHIGASARHHSPLNVDQYFEQQRKRGMAAAYYVQKNPDHKKYCLGFEQVIRGHVFKENFEAIKNEIYARFSEDFLNSDIVDCDESQYQLFRKFLGIATNWLLKIHMAEYWFANIPQFSRIYDLISQTLFTNDSQMVIDNFKEAHSLNSEFFPLAMEFARILVMAEKKDEACRVLAPFSHLAWSQLRLAQYTMAPDKQHLCMGHIKQLFKLTSSNKDIDWERRNQALPTIEKLRNNGYLDLSWAKTIYGEMSCNAFSLNVRQTFSKILRTSDNAGGKNDISFHLDRLNNLDNLLHKTAIENVKVKGKITWFSLEKNFGFARIENSDKLVFIHKRFISKPKVDYFIPGTPVKFILFRSSKGLEARDLELDLDLEFLYSKLIDKKTKRFRNHSELPLIFDKITSQIVKTVVQPGEACIDCGAHLGESTIPMIEAVGEKGVVYAFEPNPVILKNLRIRLSRISHNGNVKIFQHALADFTGNSEFKITSYPMSSGLKIRKERENLIKKTVTVPVCRLDDVVEPNRTVSFIRCDVEGAEFSVLKGAREILSRHRPVVVFESEGASAADNYGYIPDEFLAYWEALDYFVYDFFGTKIYTERYFAPQPSYRLAIPKGNQNSKRILNIIESQAKNIMSSLPFSQLPLRESSSTQ